MKIWEYPIHRIEFVIQTLYVKSPFQIGISNRFSMLLPATVMDRIGWDMLSWASETYAVLKRIWRGEWLMSSSWQVFKERQDMSTISIHTRFRHQEKARDSFRILNFSARQRQQIKTFPNQVWSIHATGDGPICSNTVFTREWQDFWLWVGFELGGLWLLVHKHP